MTTLSTTIPFPGFYESMLTEGVDRDIKQWAENMAETYEGFEASSFHDRHIWDYRKTSLELAKKYLRLFNRLASDQLGIQLGLEFDELVSPKEYNFTTDRVFAKIPLKTVRALRRRSLKEDGHEALEKRVKERFTSRSGFISFYTTDLTEWLAKPTEDWDANEIGTLLESQLENPREIEDEIEEYLSGNGGFSVWDKFTDWSVFQDEAWYKQMTGESHD